MRILKSLFALAFLSTAAFAQSPSIPHNPLFDPAWTNGGHLQPLFGYTPANSVTFYADGTNIGLRLPSTTGDVFFQNSSGATNYASLGSHGLSVGNASIYTDVTMTNANTTGRFFGAGFGTGGGATLHSSLNIPVTGATANYEKMAIYARVITADPSTYSPYVGKDAVGVESQAFIATGNMSGRAWSYNAGCIIPVGADGICYGFEIGIENSGVDQPLSAQINSKYGMHIGGYGTYGGTAVGYFDGLWHDGFVFAASAIQNRAIRVWDGTNDLAWIGGNGEAKFTGLHVNPGNSLFFGGTGVSRPGGVGEKIQLFGTDGVAGSNDYSIGVEAGALWLNTNAIFNFYVNNTLVNSMSAAGVLSNAGVIPVRVRAMSFASANTDVAVTIPLPAGVSRWALVGTSGARLANASASLTAGTVGIFTGAGGAGQTIAANQAITVSATAADTNNNMQVLTLTNAATEFYTDTTIYVRTGTAASGTGDIILYITPVS